MGAGLEVYHTPGSTNLHAYGNLFWGCRQGVEIAETTATVRIEHNTFVACYDKVKATYHGTLYVRSNLGDATQNLDLSDPNNSASTTASNNYWNQTLGGAPNYLPQMGSSAIRAGDGADCGWKPSDTTLLLGNRNIVHDARLAVNRRAVVPCEDRRVRPPRVRRSLWARLGAPAVPRLESSGSPSKFAAPPR
ncbi:MAG: hypothetical protein U0838_13105 [Chloroflexota bacterium]